MSLTKYILRSNMPTRNYISGYYSVNTIRKKIVYKPPVVTNPPNQL